MGIDFNTRFIKYEYKLPKAFVHIHKMREKCIKSKKGLFVIICFIIYTVLYIIHSQVIKFSFASYIEIGEEKPIYVYKGTEDYLINTTGCILPNYVKKLTYKKIKNYYKTCEKRAVNIFHQTENNTITFKIQTNIMKKYSKGTTKYDCCYSFVSRSTKTGKEDTELNYSSCTPFEDRTTIALSDEVVTVTCYDRNKNHKSIIYKDAYIFVNKMNATKSSDDSWNFLMVGMDTMSRARLISTMPHTFHYLQENGWLDYRGYHKIGPNTFPNLIGALTGKKLNKIYKACTSGLDNCNDLIIWSKFREAGYITAYGEDFLSLPDTFSRYNGFKTKPTHHYMRPLFLTGEQRIGNIICAGNKPSAKHILGYASDYINAYRNDKFFGLFWINSYSHNLEDNPTKFDSDIVDFLQQIAKIEMDNTFIAFFSDHGIRFGDMRIPMESYYEERLPMFFLWTPHKFRKLHPDKYNNLQLNQNRLVTPYDLHATFFEMMNTVKNDDDVEMDACPQCSSIFEEKSVQRKCADASIADKWCSCHGMTAADTQDRAANESLQFAVSYIQTRTEGIETIDCWKCAALKLHRVIRSHWYKDDSNRSNYVVAFEMVPGNVSFEVTVVAEGEEFQIVDPTDTISVYKARGKCVVVPSARSFCVCEQIQGCKKG